MLGEGVLSGLLVLATFALAALGVKRCDDALYRAMSSICCVYPRLRITLAFWVSLALTH